MAPAAAGATQPRTAIRQAGNPPKDWRLLSLEGRVCPGGGQCAPKHPEVINRRQRRALMQRRYRRLAATGFFMILHFSLRSQILNPSLFEDVLSLLYLARVRKRARAH